MKKIIIFTIFIVNLFSQNLYFEAYKNIKRAKKILQTNPDQAQRLFIESYGYLKQIVNNSIKNNKPSSNAYNLLGLMYLNGWGIEKNEEKAFQLLCAASQLGNKRAKSLLKKLNKSCKKINYKELQQ